MIRRVLDNFRFFLFDTSTPASRARLATMRSGAQRLIGFINRIQYPLIELERSLERDLALKPGTLVKLTGSCCLFGQRNPGLVCRIVSFDQDAGDYRVRPIDLSDLRNAEEREQFRTRLDDYSYACHRGLEVVS